MTPTPTRRPSTTARTSTAKADDTTPPARRPAFDALVSDLRQLAQRQDVAKARRNANEATARAAELFKAGRITSADFNRLYAQRLRLDAELPLPGSAT